MADTSKNTKLNPLVKIGLIVVFLVCLVTLKLTTLLLMVGMLPTSVTLITDRSRGRPLFQTVFAFNFSACFFYTVKIAVGEGNSTAALQDLLRDPVTWFTIFCSAGLGYMVFYFSPYVAMGILKVMNHGRLMHIQNLQSSLEADWGEAIKEEAPLRQSVGE